MTKFRDALWRLDRLLKDNEDRSVGSKKDDTIYSKKFYYENIWRRFNSHKALLGLFLVPTIVAIFLAPVLYLYGGFREPILCNYINRLEFEQDSLVKTQNPQK